MPQQPMYLPEVENKPDGQGVYADTIRLARQTGQTIPQIWHLFAFKPAATKHLERLTHEVMRGPSPLSPGMRELIATYTSAGNKCPFCLKSHAPVSAFLLNDQELVDEVVRDPQTSRLPEAEKALFAFVGKVTRSPYEITSDDTEALRAHGWTDEAIYDAITVCALFNFYNRWIHASGVHALTPEEHQAGVPRLASGYLRTKD